MDEQQAQRLASNELLFRTVNEQIVGLNETFEPLAETSVFVCECSAIGCIEQIEMTLAEYMEIRRDRRRFVVAPSEQHVVPEIERVVLRTDRYLVVEKQTDVVEAADGAPRG